MLMMLAYGLDGFAHAAEALAGSAYGAGDGRAFRKAVNSSTVLAAVTALLISLIYLVFGSTIIGVMTDIDEVLKQAQLYLPWLIASPMIAVWSYQYDGIYIGALQTRIMRDTVGVSLIVFVILVLVTVPHGGNHALWASLMVFLLLRGVLLYLKYPRLLAGINTPVDSSSTT